MIKGNNNFRFGNNNPISAATVCLVLFALVLAVSGMQSLLANDMNFETSLENLGTDIVLNEVDVDTPDAVSEACQYIEVKGQAGTAAPNNLFFLSIDGDSGVFGAVNYVADLTGVTFGSNGTITIISNSDTCAGRTYPAGTTIVESNSIALGFGAETFLLSTTTKPAMIFEGQDLDVNNDGVLDASFGLTPIDGIGWVLNATFNKVYGGAPILVDSGNGDLPDAVTRFLVSNSTFDAASWYYGELGGTSGNSTAYTAPLSPNFPACGVLTPGNQNTLSGCGGTPTNTPTSTPTTTSTSTQTNTATATATTTNTPTSTPTGSGTPSIAGTITYGNPASPGTKFISNATVASTAGSPSVTTTTAAPGGTAGQYLLTGFGSGNYTIGVTKTTGQNGISSFDAAQIAGHAAGTAPITAARRLIAADTSGNGVVSSFDAGQVARFAAGLGPPFGNANQWRFFVPGASQPTFPIGASPTTRSYTGPIGNLTGQDYIGILLGEVSGNWTAGAARPAQGPERSTAVTAPKLVTPADNEVIIPVSVTGAANKGVVSYEFDLRYDPAVIQPQADPVDAANTASRGLMTVVNANEPGLLRVVAYGPMPIDDDGILIKLRFIAVGQAGSNVAAYLGTDIIQRK